MTDAAERVALPTEAEMNVAALRRRMQAVSRRLEDLSVSVRHRIDSLDRVPSPGVPNYATVAATVQREVLWGLANLSIDALTSPAADADVAKAREMGNDLRSGT